MTSGDITLIPAQAQAWQWLIQRGVNHTQPFPPLCYDCRERLSVNEAWIGRCIICRGNRNNNRNNSDSEDESVDSDDPQEVGREMMRRIHGPVKVMGEYRVSRISICGHNHGHCPTTTTLRIQSASSTVGSRRTTRYIGDSKAVCIDNEWTVPV